MIKRTLLTILIPSVFLLGCKDDKQGKTPDYWLDNSAKVIQYPIDSSYLQKGTVLSGKMNNLQSLVTYLDRIKRKDTTLTKENLQ